MSTLIGQDLGRYHIVEQLGEGGMATVHKASDNRLERLVAIKFIRKDAVSPERLKQMLSRFEREARSLAKLTHPNIVGIIDYGEYEGSPYLVMEYLEGGTLKSRVGQPMPYQEAAHLLAPIARALDYAHRQNIIHRDIKPSNILITASGEPMLSDFGVVKILEEDESTALTGIGMGVGTPKYMAPEQWVGKAVSQTDQYALGIVFYELITGRAPYDADTPAAIFLKQANEPLPRPQSYVPALPEEVEQVIFKVLAKNPNDRYPDMSAFAAALEQLSHLPGNGLHIEEVTKTQSTVNTIELPAGEAVTVDTQTGDLDEHFPKSSIIIKKPETIYPTAQPQREESYSSFLKKQYDLILTLSPGVNLELVCIPAGEFLMGSDKKKDKSAQDDEMPQHKVVLKEYLIGKYPVTNAQYREFVKATGYEEPSHWWSREAIPKGEEQYPVVNVLWEDAIAFCQWISRVSVRDVRLPNEAEWEKAARGMDGRIWPWGSKPPDNTHRPWDSLPPDKPYKPHCNFDKIVKKITPVGQYSPQGDSPYGCVDMAGNVWEWTSSIYKGYPYDVKDGRESLKIHDVLRVLRGGAFCSNEDKVRCAYRNYCYPWGRRKYFGFRVVVSS